MRDLHLREAPANGEPHMERVDLRGLEDEAPSAPTLAAVDSQLRTVRREQKVAGIAVMLLDAAKMIEPVVELLSDRLLRWTALAASVGLSAYALHTASLHWERLAIVGAFGVLAPWIIRKR